MVKQKIRAGIIGGSMNNKWASQTHIPALLKHPSLDITAIGTSRMESARKSAEDVGATLAFDDAKKLAASEDVDMVVVSVKVPHHYEAVMAAIQEGKHIFCEWPLGANTAEATEMAKAAELAGIHHTVGLQARQDFEVQMMRKLVEDGTIGEIVSCHMQVATPGKGGRTDQDTAYLLNRASGANLLTINGGHSLDALQYLVGEFRELSAITSSRYNEAIIHETGEVISKDTADQILIHGLMENGAPTSVHIQGGVNSKFELEIQGKKGILRLSQNPSLGHIQFGNLTLEKLIYDPSNEQSHAPNGDFETISIAHEPDSTLDFPKEGVTLNVAKAHHVFARDILTDTRLAPDFNHALKLHQLLDRIEESAATGKKIVW
ncbi:putative dehydrogenase [Paenibacillus jamilae]|uniref:Gfo/Idh/MocA family protein n=1 Tax=Paenibacillus TaxID=44249 RepID=UPI000EDB4D17|nr:MULTISPECIES: Gfo/Idh/MocA family oxidoreductase [Paenibacillus]MDP9678790.1 putative dehydrogenase [Paenibacillus jamilae]KAF6615273.1 Gfo/Idh/MocA family oxidoreductase [Paenibacillus sp. EKM101P]KAF6618875.1 Gfo/Idh/MocA family oxidoreductase [Paenibacillus sp. EKM102P]KAF6627105.1 Gfo/Idh/MocA family oxidoreductase [Paenibacillus sp. EKM10P]KAF6643633.1 Gfo/Idh/MocA family oxidoreductase [Paenibacillus sp. EKM11P]